jgi:integrase
MAAARKFSRWGHRDATMILLGYRHGLRASELCDLQWSQVELATGRLHVRRTGLYVATCAGCPRPASPTSPATTIDQGATDFPGEGQRLEARTAKRPPLRAAGA